MNWVGKTIQSVTTEKRQGSAVQSDWGPVGLSVSLPHSTIFFPPPFPPPTELADQAFS